MNVQIIQAAIKKKSKLVIEARNFSISMHASCVHTLLVSGVSYADIDLNQTCEDKLRVEMSNNLAS